MKQCVTFIFGQDQMKSYRCVSNLTAILYDKDYSLYILKNECYSITYFQHKYTEKNHTKSNKRSESFCTRGKYFSNQ